VGLVLSSEITLRQLPGNCERSAIAVFPLPVPIGQGQLMALSGRQFGCFKQGPAECAYCVGWKGRERPMPIRLTPNGQNSPGGP
jgi:hypothetical protein